MIDIVSVIEAILFAAGDSVPIARLSLILGVDEKEISSAAAQLQEQYSSQHSGLPF